METLLPKSKEMTMNSSKFQIVSSECSMCGDVGLKEHLIKCTSCLFRFQHTYCSSLYPNIDLERFSCEWCNYRVTQNISASNQISSGKCEQRSDLFISVNGRKASEVKEKPHLQIHARRRYKRLADLNF
ncbi:uncharacterized protein LOC131055184 [Cryptomeria japonica]|uniref:uncharacterized protein LOC131055184 n=1 Tax=Cryptomeria japonica TaxID=3369 RepID=UPI0027DA430C|nr:uncharacterized protein LOC131055184 [Cryptomeria japonica]